MVGLCFGVAIHLWVLAFPFNVLGVKKHQKTPSERIGSHPIALLGVSLLLAALQVPPTPSNPKASHTIPFPTMAAPMASWEEGCMGCMAKEV